ncbi:MAG: hypothetical protein ACE5GU_11040 [Candidatus Scalinduaceae bacterium]
MTKQEIDESFPNLAVGGYSITSPEAIEYNCIAWAAGDTEAWWWPDPLYQYYWPPEIPRAVTINAFIKAFELLGYSVCDGPEYESDFEKVAIYADSNGNPTHVTKQLDSGKWTSKLGRLEDIEHPDLNSIINPIYGSPVVYLKRPKKNTFF